MITMITVKINMITYGGIKLINWFSSQYEGKSCVGGRFMFYILYKNIKKI